MKPTLSVIVPAYNSEKFIESCINSILVDKDANIELVVINDGSTDTTADIVRSFQDPRITFLEKENGGVSSARNLGIENASGEYLMFVDSDDQLVPEWFNTVSPYTAKNYDIVAFLKNAQRKKYSIQEIVDSLVGNRSLSDLNFITAPWSKLFRTSFVREHNLSFNRSIINGEDRIFNLEAFLNTENYTFDNAQIYRYRRHLEAATRTYNRRIIDSNKEYLNQLEILLSRSESFSTAQTKNYVNYSFCESAKILTVRLAQTKTLSDLREALRHTNKQLKKDQTYLTRLKSTSPTKDNSSPTKIIYWLTKMNLLSVAVLLVRPALYIRNRREASWA